MVLSRVPQTHAVALVTIPISPAPSRLVVRGVLPCLGEIDTDVLVVLEMIHPATKLRVRRGGPFVRGESLHQRLLLEEIRLQPGSEYPATFRHFVRGTAQTATTAVLVAVVEALRDELVVAWQPETQCSVDFWVIVVVVDGCGGGVGAGHRGGVFVGGGGGVKSLVAGIPAA